MVIRVCVVAVTAQGGIALMVDAVERVVAVIDDKSAAILLRRGPMRIVVCHVIADLRAHTCVGIAVGVEVLPGGRHLVGLATHRLRAVVVGIMLPAGVAKHHPFERIGGAVLVDGGGDAHEHVRARAITGQPRRRVGAAHVGVIAIGEVVAGVLVAAARIGAHVTGQVCQRERAQDGRRRKGAAAALLHRVVAAQVPRVPCRLGGARRAVVVGTVIIGVGPTAHGGWGQVVEIDRPGDDRQAAQIGGHPVGELFDGGVANGGIAARGHAVLQVGDQDHFVGAGAGSLVGGNDLVHIPLVIVAAAPAVGPVLQRVGGAAQLVVRARLIPDVETRGGRGRVQDLDLEVGNMLGIEEVRGANRDQAVPDLVHPVQEVPGGAPVDLGADRAQREVPAIPHVVGRGGEAVPLVGNASGVVERELWRKAPAAGSELQGVAVAELAGVALHRGQV